MLRQLRQKIEARTKRALATIQAEIVAKLACRLILNRKIDTGALTQWKTRLPESSDQRVVLVNQLLTSSEYSQLVQAHAPSISLHYLHQARCHLVRNLPAADAIVDLGGAMPNVPEGCLVWMGYPHSFSRLRIIDVPEGESVEQRGNRQQYSTHLHKNGVVEYSYVDMANLDSMNLQCASADLFWMGQSVEHIPEVIFDALLKTIYASLKPGGHSASIHPIAGARSFSRRTH